MEGTHAPSPFEQLWDRYRSLIIVVITAVLLALAGQFAWKRYEQGKADEKWSSFHASLGMEVDYGDLAKVRETLVEKLDGVDVASLEKSLATADASQKPYFLLAIARRAMIAKEWDRASQALDQLESGYPKHVLVTNSKFPVQSREQEKPEDPTKQPRKIEWKPAKEGSAVSIMRQQIAAAREFQMPQSFEKPEIPADATRVKFTFGDYGSFTLALMPQAPKHAAKFLELATMDGGAYWVGTAVDEIVRGTDRFDMPDQLHFGYATSKEEDRTKWVTTEPSEYQLDWEDTGLSHFAGAVSADAQEEGKSCANRLYVSVDDNARFDEQRVVFAYVVEGLEALRSICEADMSEQDNERGMGRPTESIRVTAVEVLK